MPTNQEEKPGKPRSRSRKADQRNQKAAAKAKAAPEQVKFENESVSAMAAPIEETPIEETRVEETLVEVAPAEAAPAELVSENIAQVEAAPAEVISELAEVEPAPVVAAVEKAEEKTDTALSGEVLPPEGRRPATPAVGLPAIALAYGEYSRKSWATGRFLVERLIAARSFNEAIDIQGEFARQVYTNFVVQSDKLCMLYGEWARQSFRPYEKLASEWTRVGR